MLQSYSLNNEEKKFCIRLARDSIAHYFEKGSLFEIEEGAVPEKLREKKACFVTLAINGSLRGCIGHLEATQPLYTDIIQNAVASAFQDPRFSPLTQQEFPGVKVEVSVLTDPVAVSISSPESLLEKIIPGKHGIILRKGYNSATFLPSVWDEIREKEDFLGHLCVKAGLAADEWRKPGMKVFFYEAIKAKE